MMEKFIHHERITSDWMGEEEGFDVIEDSDGFKVYENSMVVAERDSLEEAVEEAERLRAEEDRQRSEADRQRIVEAREAKLLQGEAEEIANMACFLINARGAKFQTRYARQALLEHVIPILQERV
jgi:hypothetical protein